MGPIKIQQARRKRFLNLLWISVVGLMSFSVQAEETITLFPLDRYPQAIEAWLKPEDPHAQTPLLSTEAQQKHMGQFYEHFAGALSPWHAGYVNEHLQATGQNSVQALQHAAIEKFGNQNKTEDQVGYGVNFHPYPHTWVQAIERNMQRAQFSNLSYQAKNRGIVIDHLHARLLPTDDVHYHSHKIAGEGYPFDNLQMSSIWVGTPVYILGESRDHHWLLVLTPDFLVWVKANGIARVSEAFIKQWQAQAKKNLVAVMKTDTPLKEESGRYLSPAYVGSVFPAEVTPSGFRLMVPVSDMQGHAVAKYAEVSKEVATHMPLKATPQNFASVLRTLVGRPYGWGNLYFYNDCSAELKHLFTPFGIWLPRQSADQAKIGKMIDLSASSREERLAYLMEKGHPLMTLIYVGGHIILYVGKYPALDKTAGAWMAMTYQNLWGLAPKPALKRAVIGRAVFFPLLLQYPEDLSLVSQADKGTFQMIYLDE